jgi:hypothetical protein
MARQDWKKVTVTFTPEEFERLAALTSGDVRFKLAPTLAKIIMDHIDRLIVAEGPTLSPVHPPKPPVAVTYNRRKKAR